MRASGKHLFVLSVGGNIIIVVALVIILIMNVVKSHNLIALSAQLDSSPNLTSIDMQDTSMD